MHAGPVPPAWQAKETRCIARVESEMNIPREKFRLEARTSLKTFPSLQQRRWQTCVENAKTWGGKRKEGQEISYSVNLPFSGKMTYGDCTWMAKSKS